MIKILRFGVGPKHLQNRIILRCHFIFLGVHLDLLSIEFYIKKLSHYKCHTISISIQWRLQPMLGLGLLLRGSLILHLIDNW
jgi:hypothetical protein